MYGTIPYEAKPAFGALRTAASYFGLQTWSIATEIRLSEM